MLVVNFTERYVKPIEGEPGMDILQAEYSLSTVFSVNKAVLTPIPYGVPHVQTNCGVTIGTKTVSGSVTSITSTGGRAWGRGKRPLATAGGYPDPAQERISHEFSPRESTNPKSYRFEFTYSAQFPQLNF